MRSRGQVRLSESLRPRAHGNGIFTNPTVSSILTGNYLMCATPWCLYQPQTAECRGPCRTGLVKLWSRNGWPCSLALQQPATAGALI